MKYDVVIIGAGIIGSLVADNLAQYDLKTLVIEKEGDSGLEQSMSSSAIVHSGIDPKPGTLKAKFNVEGNRMMKALCQELDVEYLNCGGYVCATSIEERSHLEKLQSQGIERGIECQIISGDELRSREPNVSANIVFALDMPTTGVIYPVELTIAALERSMNNGVDVLYNTRVQNISFENGQYLVETNDKCFEANYIINAAGIYSDVLAKMVDPCFEVEIKPKRGEYFVTDNVNPIVSSVIYPVPNANGKGVLAVPTTHKNVLLGPNGIIQDSRDDDSTHVEDLSYVQANVGKTLNRFPTDIIKTYTGLRSSGNNGDFYIEACKVSGNMMNLVAIDSPGIASAPGIAKYVTNWLEEKINPTKLKTYNPERTKYIALKDYSLDEQNEFIKKDKLFGKIICRCEQVSEGEIREAIRKQNGARDLMGIKFRIRPMLGMCQGGFCETEVVRIIADELGLDMSEITRKGNDTIILKGASDEKL